MTNKNTGSKELNNIFEAIQQWVNKHDGNVQFVASFLAFEGKDFDIVDDRILVFGHKSLIKDSLKDIDEEVEKEKEDFINW